MKILVLSDSHSGLSFMRRCIDAVRPDRIIHLGDYFDDALAMKEEYPHIPLLHVPGNCDHYRCPPGTPEILIERIDGVNLYMTHGHLHQVKMGTGALVKAARQRGADAALFGHTHIALCEQLEDGMWLLNPGSCGYYGGSAGIILVQDGKIQSCRVIRQADLEETV